MERPKLVKYRPSKKNNAIFGPLETNGRADGNQKKAFPNAPIILTLGCKTQNQPVYTHYIHRAICRVYIPGIGISKCIYFCH